jgi:hypothetical protein
VLQEECIDRFGHPVMISSNVGAAAGWPRYADDNDYRALTTSRVAVQVE